MRFLLLLPLLLAACSSQARKPQNNLSEPQGRVFNPQSRNYEWNTPGSPPVSPGTENTSRQPYR